MKAMPLLLGKILCLVEFASTVSNTPSDLKGVEKCLADTPANCSSKILQNRRICVGKSKGWLLWKPVTIRIRKLACYEWPWPTRIDVELLFFGEDSDTISLIFCKDNSNSLTVQTTAEYSSTPSYIIHTNHAHYRDWANDGSSEIYYMIDTISLSIMLTLHQERKSIIMSFN